MARLPEPGTTSSPPVPVVSAPEPPQPVTLVCANCHAPLGGEYCSACGQRHEPHVHTLSHFAGEAFESVSHADSRLWLTLRYLLTRPGFLTKEFFAGHRAGYLPPFRLYLVISLLFFVVAGTPQDAEIIRIDQQATPAAEAAEDKPVVKFRIDEPGVEKDGAKDDEKDSNGVAAGVRDFCDQFKDLPDSDNETRNNIRGRCRVLASDGGREFAKTIVHNLPRAMFIFLPIIAAIMKLLYWRPKRYYVEHLLFLLHNHALVFLVLIPTLLFARVPVVGAYSGWLNFAVFLYLAWYMYRGMRNYYGQGRALTLTKYFVLHCFYLVTTCIVLLLTVIYSAVMG